MKSLLLFVSFGLVIGSCSSDSPVTEKVEAKAGDAVSPAAAMDTGFKAYSGIVPCADCSGLAIDLQLRDAFRMETYQFILRETHQGASAAKAKTIESRGFYNFWRGNDTDPDATILVLNDDSTEDKKKVLYASQRFGCSARGSSWECISTGRKIYLTPDQSALAVVVKPFLQYRKDCFSISFWRGCVRLV